MSVGLKGLKGLNYLQKYKSTYDFNSLSQQQKNKWLADNKARLDAQGVKDPFVYSQMVNQFYKNDFFKKSNFGGVSGNDLFGKLDASQRDQMLNENAVNSAFSDYLGKNKNFGELSTLTTEGKEELLNSGYIPQSQIDAQYKFDMSPSEVKKREKEARNAQAWAPGMAGASNDVYGTMMNAPLKKKEDAEKGNADILKSIVAKDNERKQQSVAPDVENLISSWQSAIDANKQIDLGGGKSESYTKYIDRLFEKIAGGSTETVNDGFGARKQVTPGSRYYKAFKGQSELENLSLQDKMKFLANYMAIANKYGQYDAFSNLETQMQNYISDNQSGWMWAGQTLKNVLLGGIANIMNKLNGLNNMAIASTSGEEALANHLQGTGQYTFDGSDIFGSTWNNKVWNPKYWEGVDQYNTFDGDEIKKAEENGGLSPWQNITRAGEERGGWVTANEALKMTKFLWSDYLTGQILGKGVGTAGKLGSWAGKTAAVGNVLMSGVGISESYGMQTFNQTLQEATEKLNSAIDEKAMNYAQSNIGSKESKAQIDQYVAKEVARRKAEQQKNQREGKSTMPIDENAIRQRGTELYMQVLAQNYKNSTQGKKELNEGLEYAKNKAADAYMVDATVEEMRMAAGNWAFKKFLFGKGTRQALGDTNPYLGELESDTKGMLRSAVSKPWTTARKVLTPVFDGFQSNYLDDVTVGFGKGFGLGEYNNYIAMKYNPDEALASNLDFTTQMLSGLEYGVKGAKEASTQSQSFYDGLVGALGSVTSFGPRMTSSERQGAMESMGIRKGDKMSFMQKFNKYINNPLINNYYESQGAYNQAQGVLDIHNAILAEKKDAIQDITNVIGALNNTEQARSEGKTSLQAKNAKAHQAFQLVSLLQQWSNDPIMSQSTLVQNAQKTLEDYANGNISDQTITEFLGQGANKSIAEKDNAREEAASTIQNNAKEMLTMQKSMTEASETIENSKLGRRLSPEQKAQLVYQLAMKDNWKTRLSEMEQEISGNEQVSDAYNSSAEYGSKKAWERKKSVQEQDIADIQSQIDEITDKRNRVQEKKEDAKRSNRGKYTALDESLRIQQEALEERLSESKAKLQQINKDESLFKNEENEDKPYSDNILTKEEIIALNPEQRAAMFRNSRDYSPEQQKIISELYNELKQKNPDILQSIVDSAELSTIVKANDKSYAKLTDEKNSVAASMYFDGVMNSRQNSLERLLKERTKYYISKGFDDAARLDAQLGTTEEQAQVKAYAKTLSYDAVMDYIKDNTAEGNSVEDHPLYNIAQVIKTQSDAVGAINTLFAEEGQSGVRNSLTNVVKSFTQDANTEEEVMSSLEDAIDAQTDEGTKGYLEAVLNKMQELNHQRNATKIADRKTLAEKKKQEAHDNDGKNFDWEGYKVGDTVYNDDKGKGTVIGFTTDSANNNLMKVKFDEESDDGAGTMADTFEYNSKFDKSIIRKNAVSDVPTIDNDATDSSSMQLTDDVPTNVVRQYTVDPNLKVTKEQANKELGGRYTDAADDDFVNTEEQKHLENAASYLNGEKTAKEFLLDYGYTEEGSTNFFTNASEEEIKKEADRIANKYKGLLVNNLADTSNVAEGTQVDDNTVSPGGYSKNSNKEETSTIVSLEDVNIEETSDGTKVSSPTLSQQVLGTDSVVMEAPKQDTTDGGNRYDSNSPDLLAGNFFLGQEYNAKTLSEEGVQIKKVSASAKARESNPNIEADKMEIFQKWLTDNKIRLQDIVDDELCRIIEAHPDTKIFFMQFNNFEGSRNLFKDTLIPVIEYTSAVAKHHNEDNGGVITANGKQYLVVGGSIGYTNFAQRDNYNAITRAVNPAKYAYFRENPNELYYVNEGYHTKFNQGTAGYIVRQLEGQSEVTLKPVGDLANGEVSRSNPEGLALKDMGWVIQKGSEWVPVKCPNPEKVLPPKDALGNSGNTFLLIKAANGNYIPAYIKPVMLSEIKEDSELHQQIYDLLNALTDIDYNNRLDTIKELSKRINLDENNQILIGGKSFNVLTIVQDGNKTSFTLGPNFDRAEFLRTIGNSKFRINITEDVLRNNSTLKMYNDAGALVTDIAKIGTSNMIYSVFPCDSNGEPIISENTAWNTATKESSGELSRKYAHSVIVNNKVYREREGVFYDENNRSIPTQITKTIAGVTTTKNNPLYLDCYWNQYIQINQVEPITSNSSFEYYLVKNDPVNPVVLKRDKNHHMTTMDASDAVKMLNKINSEQQSEERAKNAEAAIEILDKQEMQDTDRQMNAINNGNIVDQNGVRDLSQEEMEQQLAGNFEDVDEINKETGHTGTDVTEEHPIDKPKKDVNDISNGLLSGLPDSNKITTFADAHKNQQIRQRIIDIFTKKGWEWKGSIMSKEAFLKSKGVSLVFNDINDFLKQLEECI